MNKKIAFFTVLAFFSFAMVGAVSINLDWIYPTQNINVSQNYFFNVTINVSCSGGNCGEINVSLDPAVDTVYGFTTCKATGRLGPNQTQCDSNYTGTTLSGLVTVRNGTQNWTVPYTGTYTIKACGAKGGTQTYTPSYLGGNGSCMQGDFRLVAGEVIQVIVGQKGEDTRLQLDNAGPGGGGGSFVFRSAFDSLPLIAAGGGGSGGRCNSGTTQNANNGTSGYNGGAQSNAGTNGNGSTRSTGSDWYAGGGAGWLTDGTGGNNAGNFNYIGAQYGAEGGRAPRNGSYGGIRWNDGTDEGGDGGFGGGGAGGSDNMGGGGGGGYSGGGGASSTGCGNDPGGGSGSYNNGTNQNNTAGANADDGYIIITYNVRKSGLVSTSVSATPFYTNVTNPYNLTLNNGESQEITWWVNATGIINNPYEFFIYANLTSNFSIQNQTPKLNITILDTTSPITNIIYPLSTDYANAVRELNYTYSDSNPGNCWWSNNSGIWNSTSVTAGTNWTGLTSIEGWNNWTVYCNDSSKNMNSASVAFYKFTPVIGLTLIYPTGNMNVIQDDFFNVTVNVSCLGGNCGQINVSLDPSSQPVSCEEILDLGLSSGSGNYTIYPFGNLTNITVYCDMVTDGGGWTLVFAGKGSTATYSSTWAGWYTMGSTTNPISLSVEGKSPAYDFANVSDLMLYSTYGTDGQLLVHLNRMYDALINLTSPNPGDNNGNSSWNSGLRGNFSSYNRTGSHFLNNWVAVWMGDGSADATDRVVFSTSPPNGDWVGNDNLGAIGGESRTSHNTDDWYYIYVRENISYNTGKSGLVSTNTSATPFYTNVTNPYNITLNVNQSVIITWDIKSTGSAGTPYTFFVYANLTSNMSISNATRLWNVTILDIYSPTFSNFLNQTSEYSIAFGYQINATDTSGISCFRVNDTANFNTNCTGWLKNNTFLNVSVYWLNITVNDTSNNLNSVVIKVNVSDTTPPTFNNLVNLSIEQNTSFGYQVNTTDVSGISCFTVNDTTNFNVNCSGWLKNNTILNIGAYWLTMSVNDSYNNTNSVLMLINITASPRIEIALVYPAGNINVNQSSFFNVTVNVSCSNANCGAINLTFARDTDKIQNGNFETGNLTGWITGGNANWAIQSTNTSEGSYAVKSGAISHSQSTWINRTVTLRQAATLVFYWNVSSESCCDFLYFCNGTSSCTTSSGYTDRIGGSINWQRKEYNLSAGTHILHWGYGKDGSVSTGSDTGWIDNVTLLSGDSVISLTSGATPFYTNVTNPYNLTLNQGQSQEITWWVNATGTSINPYTLFVYANLTSNMSLTNTTNSWNITINDITPPLFTNVSNKSVEYKTALSHTIGATDTFGISCFRVNNTDFLMSCAGVLTNNSVINVGFYWLNITVNDTSNNLNSIVINVNVSDTTSPTVTITYPANNTNYNRDINVLNYTAADSSNLSSCWWSNNSGIWNSTPVTAGTNWTGLTSMSGWNNWTVYCNDSYNNIGSRIHSFFKDTVVPIFNNLSNQSIGQNNGLGLQINATDENGISCFIVNDTTNFNINCSGWLRNNSILFGGMHWLNITVNDTYNNKNSVIIYINVSDTTFPVFNNLANTTITQDNSLGLQINATDASGISCFRVNDTTNFNINCSGWLKNNTVLSPGFYWLNITVNDTLNNLNSAYIWVNVTPVPRIGLVLISPSGNILVSQNKTFAVSVNVSCSNVDCGEVNFTLDSSSSKTYRFTTCKATGTTGPSQASCTTNYTGTTLAGLVTVVGGIQNWTVPYTGNYIIQAAGAAGGTTAYTNYPGRGSIMTGTFYLTAGQVIRVLVGQQGAYGYYEGGGGGGSFVVLPNNDPLIIAGGGGGPDTGNDDRTSYSDALNTSSGRAGEGTSTGGTSGNGGSAGASGNGASGGGGFAGNGGDGYSTSTQGLSFTNGGTGGTGCSSSGSGGFGGGGGSEYCYYGSAAGGGGYSGGGGGGASSAAGGGGGSINNGTNQNNTGGINTGDGYVNIIFLGMPVSTSTSATPFYTNVTNPYNITLNVNQSTIITWTVNATGAFDNYTFFVYANKTLNMTIWNATRTWNVTIVDYSTTAPTISINYPSSTNYTNNVSILNYTVSGTNLNNCWWSNNSGIWNSTSVTAGTNWTGLTSIEGWNNWTVYCNNLESETTSNSTRFYKDSINPNVTLISPENGYVLLVNNSGNVTFNCSVTDTLALRNISLYITNNANGNFALNATKTITGTSNTTNWTLNLANGSYTWNCLAYDSSGNQGWSNNRTLRVQSNSPPTVTLNSPLNNSNLNSRTFALLNASVYDVDGILNNLTVWFYGGSPNGTYSLLNIYYNQTNGTTITYEWNITTSGRYNWTIIANDGRENSSRVVNFFSLINLTFSCEAGGPYQQGALVLVQGALVNETGYVSSQLVNVSVFDSSNNIDASQNLTTANDGGFETTFSGLAVGSYVLNASTNYRGFNESCRDTFQIGSPASFIIDKIITLQNMTNISIAYNVTLRATNKGGSDAISATLIDSDSSESPYNLGNISANSSVIKSYIKEYARNSSTYNLTLAVARINASDSYSGSEISMNSSGIVLAIPASETGEQLTLIKNTYYNSENSTSVNYTLAVEVVNSGGKDLAGITLIDSDLGLTTTIGLNRTQNYSYSNSVIIAKAASNTNKLFVRATATANSVTYSSNQINVIIPGYGGPADAIVSAPSSVSVSTSFGTTITVENQNPDIGQDFIIDYWITSENENTNYSSGQQTIYVAASGQSNLTATSTSPSNAGNYRFKALVSWVGGTATAYDTFSVTSSVTSSSSSSSSSSGGGSISGDAIKENIVCNPPYMRYGKECCLDKNNNSICDTDDIVAEKIDKSAGIIEDGEVLQSPEEQPVTETLQQYLSKTYNSLSKSAKIILSNKLTILILLVIILIEIVYLNKENISNLATKISFNAIIALITGSLSSIIHDLRIRKRDPTRLTNLIGIKVYSSDGDFIGDVDEIYLEGKKPKIHGWLIKANKKIAKEIGKKFILVRHDSVSSISQVMLLDKRTTSSFSSLYKSTHL